MGILQTTCRLCTSTGTYQHLLMNATLRVIIMAYPLLSDYSEVREYSGNTDMYGRVLTYLDRVGTVGMEFLLCVPLGYLLFVCLQTFLRWYAWYYIL